MPGLFGGFRRLLQRISVVCKTGGKPLKSPIVVRHPRLPAQPPTHPVFRSAPELRSGFRSGQQPAFRISLRGMAAILVMALVVWDPADPLTCWDIHSPGLDQTLLLAGLSPLLDPLGEAAQPLDSSLQRLLGAIRARAPDGGANFPYGCWVTTLEQLARFLQRLQQDRAAVIRELLDPNHRGPLEGLGDLLSYTDWPQQLQQHPLPLPTLADFIRDLQSFLQLLSWSGAPEDPSRLLQRRCGRLRAAISWFYEKLELPEPSQFSQVFAMGPAPPEGVPAVPDPSG
jgi:hypothetical protein